MTETEFIRFVNKEFKIGWPLKAFNVEVRALSVEAHGTLVVEIRGEVPHRETGCPSVIAHRQEVPQCLVDSMNGPARASQFLRGELQRWLMHELDESILAKGSRIFDPHPPEQRK